MAQPTPQQLTEIDSRLGALLQAITSHPNWAGQSNPTLYNLWDFVSRSKYLLSEYDNVKAGRAVEHPEQFKRGAGMLLPPLLSPLPSQNRNPELKLNLDLS